MSNSDELQKKEAVKRLLHAIENLDFSFERAQNPQVQNELEVSANNIRKLYRIRPKQIKR